MKKIIIQLLLLVCPFLLQAKSFDIVVTGKVVDKETGMALPGATVLDTVTHKGTVTNLNGDFILKTSTIDCNCTLQIRFIGYNTVVKNISTKEKKYSLGIIKMESDVQKISEVIIKGKVPTVILKSDTLSFNAEAVKVSSDSKGLRLLKKLPGFSVENGKIETQGEEVKKVYLNGKPFFEDDPQNAFNSLPAEMIQNIELFDDYGEVAAFTGYSSGSSVKAINIVTKPKYNNSLNGSYRLGMGSGNRFEFEGNSILVNKNHSLTVVFDGNNVNKSNSNLSDFLSFEQQIAAKLSKSVLQQPESFGEQDYKSLGINYNGKFGKKTELSFNYVFGNIDSKLYQSSLQNYQDVWFYNALDSINKSSTLNKFQLKLIHQPSERNKLIFSQKTLVMGGDQDIKSNIAGNSITKPINNSSTSNKLDQNKFSSTSTLIWLHNFKKSGRSLTAFANLDVKRNDMDQIIVSDLENYPIMSENELDTTKWSYNHNNLVDNINNKAMLRISYKEPLSMLSSLNIVGKSSYAWRNTDKKTYQFDAADGEYKDISDELSSQFKSDYWVNRAEIGYSQFAIKSIFNIGLAYENSLLMNEQKPNELKVENKTYHKILPVIYGKYFISPEQNLLFYARSKTLLPSVNQLQETVDISNPLKVVVGNSDLKAGLQHVVMGRYTLAMSESSTFLSAYGFFKYATDFIGWETFFMKDSENIYGYNLMDGTQITKPKNLDGLMQVMAGIDYSIPLKKIHCNLNLGGRYTYSKIPTVFQGVELNSYSSKYGIRVAIVSNISKDVDFNISSRTDYNYASNSNNNNDTEYLSQRIEADLNLVLFNKYSFNVEYDLTAFNYLGEYENQQNNLLNVSIGRSFFKNNKARLTFKVYDVFNQNKGLAFNLHETYNENLQMNALHQYLMVVFRLKF